MTTNSLESLVGKSLAMSISEPWEVASSPGKGPRLAEVVQADDGESRGREASILVRLQQPIEHGASEHEYFVGTSRHEGEKLTDLLRGKQIVCNLTAVTTSQAKSADPFDLSAWRGGLGLVATLNSAE